MKNSLLDDDDENLWNDPLVRESDEPLGIPDAGRRFMGFFADIVATAIAYYMLLFAVYYVYSQSSSVPTWMFEGLFATALPIVVYLLLVGGMEIIAGGQSIGKLVAGTVVMSENGSAPTAKQILIRTLTRLIPGEALMVVFDAQKRAGHDRLSKTVVVRKNPFNG